MKTLFKKFFSPKKLISRLVVLVVVVGLIPLSIYLLSVWKATQAYGAIRTAIQSGGYGSIAISPTDGKGRLIFSTGSSIIYVRCTNASCGTNVQTTIAAGVANTQISNQGLAVDSSGFAHIVYRGVSDNSMRYINCTNSDCTGASSINIDNNGITPPSITLNNAGLPRITYPNLASGSIRVATCSNAACSVGNVTLVNITAASLQDPKIQLDPTTQYPRIVYFAGSTSDLGFVSCTSIDCSTANTPVLIDTSGTVGQYPSLVLSNDPSTLGRPMIAYYYGTGGDLRYVFCGDNNCSTGNSIITLDSTNSVGQYPSIAVGTDHLPRMTYLDSTNLTVRFLRCLDATCGTAPSTPNTSTPQVIASVISASYPTGVALDASDFGALTYIDFNNVVTYAQCLDLNCTNFAPTAPTGLFANTSSTGAASGSTNPTNLSIKAVSFSAIAHDPDGDQVNKYRLQISTNSDFSVTGAYVYDSGATGLPFALNGSISDGLRSTSVGAPNIQFSPGTTYYWRIAFYDTTGNAGAFSTETATFTVGSSITPTTQRYDAQASLNAGNYNSVAMGLDGFPRMAYNIASAGLYYARCLDALCNANIATGIDTTIGRGFYTSIAIDPTTGFARIAYQDNTAADLKFVQCTNDSCSTNVITTLKSTGSTGYYPSMVLGSDGFARIVYMDATTLQIEFFQCTNAACTTRVGPSVVAFSGAYSPLVGAGLPSAGGPAAYSPSLALTSSGLPVISFYSSFTGVQGLKVVRCGDAACSTGNTTLATDSTNVDTGHFSSLVLDSHNCESISYYDLANADLKFAQYAWNGSTCNSSPTILSLDTTGNVGSYTSLKLDSSGNPRIAYYDSTNTNVKYIRCTTSTCSSPSPTPVIVAGAANNSGFFTKMVLGNVSPYTNDDVARIVYQNGTSLDGEIAVCYSGTCAANQAPTAPATSSLFANTQANGAQVADCAPTSGKPNCTNPALLTSTSLAFSAIHTDVDGDAANQAEIQFSLFPDFSTIAVDSGPLSISNVANNSRSGNILYSPALTQNKTYYWRIKFFDVNGAAGAYSSAAATVSGPTVSITSGGTSALISVLRNTGDVGNHSKTVLGSDGFARIAYHDGTTGIRLLRCLNQSCTNYTDGLVASNATGTDISMVLTATDLPRISYYNGQSSPTNTATLTFCGDQTCSTGNSTVNFGGNTAGGTGSSLAIGSDGFIREAYYTASPANLRLHRCTNATCSTSVDTAIDGSPNGDRGRYPSMVLSTLAGTVDFPRIAYSNLQNQTIRITKCNNQDCSITGSFVDIETTGPVEAQPSLALQATTEYPVISYYKYTTGDLRIVTCGSVDCFTGNTISTVDSVGDVGTYSSLKIGPDGFASISYYDITNTNLKFAKCTNATCTTSQLNTVDSVSSSNTGQYTSLAIASDGYPRISYYDSSVGGNGNLMFVECVNAYCGTAPNSAPGAPSSLFMNTATNGAQAVNCPSTTCIDPLGLTSTDLRFSAIHNDPDLDAAIAYQIDFSTNSGFSTIYATQNGSISVASGARSSDLEVNAYFQEGAQYYWRIRFTDSNNAVGTYSATATFTLSSNFAPAIRTLFNAGSLSGEGAFISHGMRLGSKYIAYYDPSAGDVKYRLCTNTFCSTGSSQTIDSIGDVGSFVAVTNNDSGVDDGDNIVYYDATNGDLKMKSCTDGAVCTSLLDGVGDTTGIVGKYPSVVIVNATDVPKVAYYDETNGDLKYLNCTGEQCTSSTTVTLDSSGDVGKYTSITSLGDGTGVYISYYDVTNGDLKFVRCSTENCASPVVRTIDSGGDVGQFTSIQIGGDGLPHIAYYDVTNGNLKLANCTDSTCSSSTIVTLASVGDVGKYVSMKKDPVDGYLRLAYYDVTHGDLRYIRCTNASCTTKTSNIIDSTGDVGKYVSMDIDTYTVSPTTYNTYPSFAYYDATNNNIKFAKCTNSACGPLINSAPDTPTTLYSNTATNGAQSGVVNPTALNSSSVVFSAIHNDIDDDAANAYELQIATDSGFSTIVYDSENTGLAGTSMVSTPSGSRSPTLSILTAGGSVTNTLPGGVPANNIPYYWRIRFWDVNNSRGVFSSTATFTVLAGSPPTSPTVLFTNTTAAGAQYGNTNPTNLTSSSLVFSAIHNDPDGDAANKYELQISTDDMFSTVQYDSGSTGRSMTSLNNGSRVASPYIPILASGGGVINTFIGGVPSLDTTYYWRIRFWDVNDMAGAYSPNGSNAAYFLIPSVAPVNPPSGLVSWWTGDSSTVDLQGSNSAQLVNGATFAPGEVLRGFSFDGINDTVVAGDAGLPSGTSDRTVMGWIKTASTGTRYIFSYGTDIATEAFAVGVSGGKLVVTQSGSTLLSSATINDNTFHQIAVSYSATGNTYNLYIDGVLDSTGTMPTNTVLSGTADVGSYLNTSGYIAGVVDELSVFNRTLSLSEIKSVYQAGVEGMYKTITSITNASDTSSNETISLTANFRYIYTTTTGIPEDGSFTLTFPAGFDISHITEDDIDILDDGVQLTTAPTCSGTEKFSVSVSGQTITFTACNGDGGAIAKGSVVTLLIGNNTTQSGTGTHQITNPSTVGSYSVLLNSTAGDVGSFTVSIVDSNQVGINGVVPPYITFDIDTALTDGESTAPYVIALGQLLPTVLTTSDGTSIKSIFLDLNSNAAHGAIVTVFGSNGGLYSSSKNTLITPSTAEETITAGQAKFGLCVASITQVAGTGTFAASSTYDADGASNCTTSNGGTPRIGKINTTPTQLVSTNGTIEGGRVQILTKASVTPTTPAGNDYREVLTFVATGTF